MPADNDVAAGNLHQAAVQDVQIAHAPIADEEVIGDEQLGPVARDGRSADSAGFAADNDVAAGNFHQAAVQDVQNARALIADEETVGGEAHRTAIDDQSAARPRVKSYDDDAR